jgi:hypothetical protein
VTTRAGIAVLMLGLALAGCGGGGPTTRGPTPAAKAARSVTRCEVEEVEGEIYSTENDLRGVEENLHRALAGKKTVILKPGGPAQIRTYSRELLQAIHRELRDARKILRSC